MSIEVHALLGLPEVGPSDDLAELLSAPLIELGVRDGDVVVVTQKVVSKAEGRVVPEEGEGGPAGSNARRGAWSPGARTS